MTKIEHIKYIDTGEVPSYFLIEIMEYIKKGKQLTPMHIQVYMSHSSVIEKIIKNNNINEKSKII
jgi:hypothetical protein